MDAIELTERDICQGYLILVNRQHSIRMEPFQGTQRLVPADLRYPEILLASRPAALLTRLIQDCGGQGTILPVSGCRTLREQAHLFDDSLRRNARDFTHRFVAFPDCSEHQTGLAVDLAKYKPNIDLIRPDFPSALAGRGPGPGAGPLAEPGLNKSLVPGIAILPPLSGGANERHVVREVASVVMHSAAQGLALVARSNESNAPLSIMAVLMSSDPLVALDQGGLA